ncbi:MAG: porin [Bacteroidota bacterium]
MKQNTIKVVSKRQSIGQILLKASVSLAVLGTLSAPAFAVSNAEIMAELKRLQNRVQTMESKLAETEEELVQTQNDLVDAQTEAKKQNNIKFSKKTGMPEIVSSDGQSSFAIGGRVLIDAAQLPDQTKEGNIEDAPAGFYKAQTATEVRKAYLGVEGTFWKDWEYELEVDLAENEVDIKNAKVTYGGWKDNDVTFGFQKPAFGLENTQSSRYSQFMERGLTDEFSPSRDLGVSWRHVEDWGAFKVGAFIPNTIEALEDEDQLDDEGDPELTNRADAYTYTGRISYAPIDMSNQTVHLGASALYTNYSDNDGVKFSARPESHLSQKLVESQKIRDPDYTSAYGLEAAYSGHGFLIESEYVTSETKGLNGKASKTDERDKYDYDAWYVSASYMLTGESHPYSKKKGTFGAVMPDHPVSKGGWGAWEVGLRFSSIDLNDGVNYKDEDMLGGQLDDITLGVNWYLENNLKVMLNYIKYDADSYDHESGDYLKDQSDDILQARVQWFF